jgi:uncharacterized protein YneF (UPF0154 family)
MDDVGLALILVGVAILVGGAICFFIRGPSKIKK